MYEYALSFLDQYVEMKTYLSLEKLYGKIICRIATFPLIYLYLRQEHTQGGYCI